MQLIDNKQNNNRREDSEFNYIKLVTANGKWKEDSALDIRRVLTANF